MMFMAILIIIHRLIEAIATRFHSLILAMVNNYRNVDNYFYVLLILWYIIVARVINEWQDYCVFTQSIIHSISIRVDYGWETIFLLFAW